MSITVTTYSNKDYCRTFALYRMMTFCFSGMERRHTVYTVTYLRSHVPEFTEPENWPPNSLDLNPVDYGCNRWCIITKFQTLTS